MNKWKAYLGAAGSSIKWKKTIAATNLTDIALIFHDFPGLENENLKFHHFTGFPWPVQTLLWLITGSGC